MGSQSFVLEINKNKKDGLTLTELIVVVAVLGILVIMSLSFLKPRIQIGKAKDGKRKSDLKRIQVALEDYYNDHNCYPPSLYKTGKCNDSFSPYLNQVPCDPDGNFYEYVIPEGQICPQYYRIYTILTNIYDPIIQKVGCQNGCGANGIYNYGIASSNVGLETKEITPTPTSAPTIIYGTRYVCKNRQCVKEIVGETCGRYYQSENCFNACPTPSNDCYYK